MDSILISAPYKALYKDTYKAALAVLANEQQAESAALETVLSQALLSCAAAKREMGTVDTIRDRFGIANVVDLTALPVR